MRPASIILNQFSYKLHKHMIYIVKRKLCALTSRRSAVWARGAHVRRGHNGRSSGVVLAVDAARRRGSGCDGHGQYVAWLGSTKQTRFIYTWQYIGYASIASDIRLSYCPCSERILRNRSAQVIGTGFGFVPG